MCVGRAGLYVGRAGLLSGVRLCCAAERTGFLEGTYCYYCTFQKTERENASEVFFLGFFRAWRKELCSHIFFFLQLPIGQYRVP